MTTALLAIAERMFEKILPKADYNLQHVACSDAINLLKTDPNKELHFVYQLLLKTACEFNLRSELEQLLDLAITDNQNKWQIDDVINLDCIADSLFTVSEGTKYTRVQINKYISGNDKTLLGLAAYHGHYNIVHFLLNERGANPNAQDVEGNTAAHQVVYGHTYPNRNDTFKSPSLTSALPIGEQHAEVAQILLEKDASLAVLNKKLKTAYDVMKYELQLPQFIRATGSVLISGSQFIYGGELRPIFEMALVPDKSYKLVRLQNAVQQYIATGEVKFGFENKQAIFNEVKSLNGVAAWELGKQLENYPGNAEQGGVILGSMFGIVTYLHTQCIGRTIAATAATSYFAWKLLETLQADVRNRERIQQRIAALDEVLPSAKKYKN